MIEPMNIITKNSPKVATAYRIGSIDMLSAKYSETTPLKLAVSAIAIIHKTKDRASLTNPLNTLKIEENVIIEMIT